jgi:hypothetical protein
MSPDRLFDLHARRRPGRVEVAVNKALGAARKAEVIGPLDAAAAAGLRVLARELDQLESDPDSPGGTIAYVGAEFRKTLAELGLTPASRSETENDDDAGELAAVLRLGASARRDPTGER